jgi:NAD(P)-dependent dehydrogenase (short-subunit alcohol dehydrogenase family)
MHLKPIDEQVVVILGASSGIGRETALRFAARGAKVVVAARGEPGLVSLVAEITARGGAATYAVCDISEFAQVEAVAEQAVETFGRIDTWVNVAAVAVYAAFAETTPEEFRRVLDVNVMGLVHGAKAALPRLRQAGGGALIGISSIEGLVALPLHSAYAASKHAAEGLLDALRRELMAEGAPISITSIKPASMNTPFFSNARTKLGVKPQGVPPIYDPSLVADCILYAAEHPVRDLYAGGAGKAVAVNQMLAPGLVDAGLARFGIEAQKTDEPKGADAPDNLYTRQTDDYRIEGDFGEQAIQVSPFTWLETHPEAKALITAGLLAGAAWLFEKRSQQHDAPALHSPIVPSQAQWSPAVDQSPARPGAAFAREWSDSEPPVEVDMVIVEAIEGTIP